MKKQFTFFFLLALPIICSAQTFFTSTTERLGYAEYLPTTYTDTTKTFPVIIFLHGSGERGTGATVTEVKKTIINGPAKFLKGSNFIILCPQTNLWSWRSKWPNGTKRNDANEFTKWALKNYRIDPKRVYITGLSMGGEGTWFAMADDPKLYAAGIPVCGRASRAEGSAVAVGGVHVWAFHGEDDVSISFESHWNAIAGMRSTNKALIDFTVYERMGHNVWDKVYSNTAIYSWLLKYTR